MTELGFALAWLQLAKEKRRLAAAAAGITFATLLMMVQLGLKEALLKSSTMLMSHMTADLVLLNPEYQFLVSPKRITRRRLYQALGVAGVESVRGLHLGVLPLRNPRTRRDRDILLVGFRPETGVFDQPGINAKVPELARDDAVLFDELGNPDFGPIAADFRRGERNPINVGGRRMRVAGLFQVGISFGSDGTLLAGDAAFKKLLPGTDLDLPSIGLIALKPGADAEEVRGRVAAALPGDVRVLTRRQWMDLERRYWEISTPVGFVFNFGAGMGLLVGLVIVYQILYTDVSDHLKEYATMKALGYPDRALFAVVLAEALILSVLGYAPGLTASALAYRLTAGATLLPMEMTAARVLGVYAMTALMCAASGALAMRRLRVADPAEIF
ncbi:MAG: FtsX-like permease family protein [Elusimicrobia bacterium]|nr:FtsX-like permease family protein [Elusimicrobiota bacterium]